jgi:hypothetical protein
MIARAENEESSMESDQTERGTGPSNVLTNRRFVACAACGWVHYVMTAEEKAANDQTLERLIDRYQLSEAEQRLYASTYQQCLSCESPAREFRAAQERDLDRAEGHIVTPIFVEPEVGTQ